MEHHGLEPEQYCSAKGRTRWMSNNRHGHNVRSQPRDVCGRDLESSLSSSRIRKPSGRNANGQLLRDAATLHWSSSVNELLVSLIAQKGSSCYIVALS